MQRILSITIAGFAVLAGAQLSCAEKQPDTGKDTPSKPPVVSPSKPNILWITSEDNSHYTLGCYGNQNAQTPHLDRLAAKGIRFTHAYSNAPVCAVARSTILTGMYAPGIGSHHMRCRYEVPESVVPYVTYLREAGYFCTNAGKMDYNIQMDDLAIWDQSVWQSYHEGAHYKNRAEGQPFFAVFNLRPTHESRLFQQNIDEHRSKGLIPQEPRVPLKDIQLPAYLPDDPVFRKDIAIYHDFTTLMDSRAGEFLQELEDRGLAEDTIVFYFSDHGGVIPRTKRWINDTGTHVPMIIYVPEKWKHLSPYLPQTTVDEPVSFVDLAPTLLKLAGIPIPEHMQGEPIIGSEEMERETELIYLYADRFDEKHKFRRGITDGKFRYIINFLPNAPGALDIEFPYSMPSWRRWRERSLNNDRATEAPDYFSDAYPAEQLFDTDNDPWEINNLATDPANQKTLLKFRKACLKKMLSIRDLGVIPEAMFHELPQPIMTAFEDPKLQAERVIRYANSIALGQIDEDKLIQNTHDQNPVIRYWSFVGMMGATIDTELALTELEKHTDDRSVANRIAVAQAFAHFGNKSKAVDLLFKEVYNFKQDEVLTVIINEIEQLGAQDLLELEWLENVDANYKRKYYHHRLVRRILSERQQS